MTVESAVKPERKFVRDGLPWVVGAAALAVYLATLNHWVTLSSLAQVSRVTGWGWQPTLYQPLLLLLTYPFRWLPAGWVPMALNGFAAVCASLTLAMLARSVALLPHDRLEQQRLLVQNEHALLSVLNAWVPVLLATVALGLQLTFWENAIAATGDMLDLLLFAYVIRCLLEHRIHPQQSWLGRATFVFGAAMANNWAMTGFLPLFLVALLRLRRLRLFNFRSRPRRDQSGGQSAAPGLTAEPRPMLRLTQDGEGFKVDVAQVAAEFRFLLRMALLGLAGLSLLLVLPLVQAYSPDSALSFWQGLHAVATSYKATLQAFFGGFVRHNRDVALLLAAVSLLPVLVLSIRWSASALAASHAQADLAPLIFRLAHAFLLLVCVLTMFDPPFSPRQISLRFGLPVTFLPLYYLAALSIGYYSGFFLLSFGADALQRLRRRDTFLRAAYRAVPRLVYVLVGLTVAGLLLKNAPAIHAASARYLEQYARLAAGSLPPEGAVVLSGDLARLTLLQAELAREGMAERYLTVGTRALHFPAYRAWLRRKYPGRWPESKAEVKPAPGRSAASATNAPLDDVGFVQLMSRLAQSNHVYCVEPGVALMLEEFYLLPHGLLHEMRPYPPYSLSGPLLSAAELAENEAFWKHAIETDVNPLLRLVARPQLLRPDLEKSLMGLRHLQAPPPAQAKVLARWYSSALTRWGVTLQRNRRSREAAPCFALAQELNPDNLPARVNLQCSSNLLERQKMTVVRDRSFQDRFGDYLAWNRILAENGPFDEPSYCYHLGLSLAGEGMSRQAGQQLERVTALAPGDTTARLMLGDVYCRGGMPDQTLLIAAQIRADPNLQPLGPTNEVEVALLEAKARFAKTNRTEAEAIINSLLTSHPEDAGLLDRAGVMFTAYGSYSNALQIVERQLQSAPDNLAALINKGNLCLLIGDFSNAIPPLTRSLALTNVYAARIDRAFAYLQSGRLDAAEADYQELLRAFPTAYRAYYGLGEIAWQNKDTNAAIRYYQHFLSKAVARSEAFRIAAARLKSLQQEELKATPEPP
jgi:tetratricopeptide (TPR) repeat protein